MDAAAKPPWMGLRRLPQPDPPRNPTECPLLPLLLLRLLLRQVQGAALQRNPYPRGRLRDGTSANVSTASFSAWFNHARISRSSTS